MNKYGIVHYSELQVRLFLIVNYIQLFVPCCILPIDVVATKKAACRDSLWVMMAV